MKLQSITTITNKIKIFYPVLIILIWLATYLINRFLGVHEIEWDEAKYLACARGIAENFDFSSRSTTILGLIKYGFPQHTHHYPLHSLYIALFFKLFGSSLEVACFATWFSALITCLFIYLTLLLMTNNNGLFSFFLAISFLYLPRIIVQCNSAMMEIPGCALLSFSTFLIFKGISKGRVNFFLLALASIFLYFYKSLFAGITFGFISLIVFLFYAEGREFEFKKKISFVRGFVMFLGTMFITSFIFTRFFFLPLAPWMNFLPKHDTVNGTYADFAGGFFNDIFGNLKEHLMLFIDKFIFHYYPFFTYFFLAKNEPFYPIIPYWFELGIYIITFFYITLFSFFIWRSLLSIQKAFISFTVVSILIFNFLYLTITGCTGIGLFYRYNIIYFPLLIISLGIVLWVIFNELAPSFLKSKVRVYLLLVSFIILIYIPVYFSSYLVLNINSNWFYASANKNSEIIKKYIQNTSPKFIYIKGASLGTWNLFPLREIFMEATNEQIKKVNLILPKPIEYLFLTPDNALFKENQDLILNKRPIIDSLYNFYGFDPDSKTVVYRLNPI